MIRDPRNPQMQIRERLLPPHTTLLISVSGADTIRDPRNPQMQRRERLLPPCTTLLISVSRADTIRDPRNPHMQRQERLALLIRGSKPDPRRVRTGALDHQSQGRRGHAHSSHSSSPPARGCPACRVREPARAASRGDPTEGEIPRPRSLANGTEPHLANPRKRFNGRVSGPRSLPLSNGAWASTRTTH
jgi:hypothetical protein